MHRSLAAARAENYNFGEVAQRQTFQNEAQSVDWLQCQSSNKEVLDTTITQDLKLMSPVFERTSDSFIRSVTGQRSESLYI